MDLAVITGLFLGIGSVLTAIVLEKGQLSAYFNFAAFLIIMGGTFAATTISTSIKEILKLPVLLKIVFTKNNKNDFDETIHLISSMATLMRKEGILAIEKKINEVDDSILKKGLQMVVDGEDSSIISELINAEINAMEARHEKGINMFSMMGGYAPTMGIIGTVLGLVNMLMSLGANGGESLGKSVAVAFIATLYGILFANIILLPISSNLKAKSSSKILEKELILQGIIGLQSGLSPKLVEERMKSFLGAKNTLL